MNPSQIRELAGTLRWETFSESFRLAAEIGVKCIIETGTYRGCDADGQSTQLFSLLASELGADFYSVDICQEHIRLSKEKMALLRLENVRHSVCDSVLFLSLFASPIQFLYLDSYDFSAASPLPSQLHQVAELGAAWGKITGKTIVLLDDCNIEHGGKGLLSTQFLQERGFRLAMKKYQNLLVNF